MFLLKWFVKDFENTKDPAVRAACGKLSGIVGIVCNLLLFAAKLVIGTVSGAVSITADAVNNLSDASGSIVTLLGFRLASQPADEEHPYGHGRMEYFSGLVLSALILVIGVELAKSSVQDPPSGAGTVFGCAGHRAAAVHRGEGMAGGVQPAAGKAHPLQGAGGLRR